MAVVVGSEVFEHQIGCLIPVVEVRAAIMLERSEQALHLIVLRVKVHSFGSQVADITFHLGD